MCAYEMLFFHIMPLYLRLLVCFAEEIQHLQKNECQKQ